MAETAVEEMTLRQMWVYLDRLESLLVTARQIGAKSVCVAIGARIREVERLAYDRQREQMREDAALAPSGE